MKISNKVNFDFSQYAEASSGMRENLNKKRETNKGEKSKKDVGKR